MADYVVVPITPILGRVVREEEVPELVPLIIVDGGEKDGWVYDSRDFKPAPRRIEASDSVQHFEYTGEIGQLPDGRLARVYRPR
jgi:hypothetical protein